MTKMSLKSWQKAIANELAEDIFLRYLSRPNELWEVRGIFDGNLEPYDYELLEENGDNLEEDDDELDIDIRSEDSDQKNIDLWCKMPALKFLAILMSSAEDIPFENAIVKAYRITHQMSLRDLAKILDNHATALSRWEVGKFKISPILCKELASKLQLPEDIFIDDTPYDEFKRELKKLEA